jgi:hypothetical protein
MGVLYYIQKDDESREAFALNKALWYVTKAFFDEVAYPKQDDSPRLRDLVPDEAAFAARYLDPDCGDWALRVARRLFAWAGDAPLRVLSDHDEESHGPITGSAHDSDYEADGVTYIPGSAW